jgi:hypothetical protein
MPLTFSDFSPVSFSCEIRYPETYLLWDRAGQVTEDLRNHHQITRRIVAEPGKIAFVTDTSKEVTWQLDRLIVIDHQPPASKADIFYRLCSDCYDMTLRNLGVSELKRVGFRTIFAKKFSSKDDAAAALLSIGLIHVPAGKHLNIEPVQKYPEYAIRCEDEKFGYTLRLSVQEVNYELELSPQWKGNVVEPRHEDHLALDIDYFSRAALPVGSLRIEEWLAQVLHAIRRDADSYLVK